MEYMFIGDFLWVCFPFFGGTGMLGSGGMYSLLNFNLELPVSFISLMGLNSGLWEFWTLFSPERWPVVPRAAWDWVMGGVVCHKSLENDPAYFE